VNLRTKCPPDKWSVIRH